MRRFWSFCSRMTCFAHPSRAWMGHPFGCDPWGFVVIQLRGFFAALRMTRQMMWLVGVRWLMAVRSYEDGVE